MKVIILKKLVINTTKNAKLLKFLRLNADAIKLKVKNINTVITFKVVSQKLFSTLVVK